MTYLDALCVFLIGVGIGGYIHRAVVLAMTWRDDVGTVREAVAAAPAVKHEHGDEPCLCCDGWAALARLEERLERYEAALREIASVDCQIACEHLPHAIRCETCVARAALAEGQDA